MKQEHLQREVRGLVARFVTEVDAAVAMGQNDISSPIELFLLELFREAYGLPDLRNLNVQRRNFPGLDLGDDTRGVAFQITVSRDLEKVVETLTTVVGQNLHATYPRVKIFVATKKQASYKQTTIDAATGGKLQFDAKRDVLDFSDLLRLLATFELDRLERIAAILRKHLIPQSAADFAHSLGEALERDVAVRYKQAVQRSTFPESVRADIFLDLATEIMVAGADTISTALRRRILLRATRSAALAGHLETADRLLSAAVALHGPESDLPARARVVEAKGDVEGAIRLLRDDRATDSMSTLLSVLSRNRGDAVALSWFTDAKLSVADLTSNGIIALSQIYLRAERFDDLNRMLDDVSEMQTDECPYLLYLRGIVRLSSVFPIPDRLLISGGTPLHLGVVTPVLPQAELAMRLDAALGDLQRLLPTLRELDLTETLRVSGAYVLWCELLHPHRRARALTQLRKDMQQPAKAVHCVQFAFAFDPDFDPLPLEEWLRKRQVLGGLDDDELRAALIVRMHGDDPTRVAEIIAKHRKRYGEALGDALTLILEVQALAAAHDATSARVLLDAASHQLEPATVARLGVEIAKAEGADPVVEHLRAYESTKTPNTLRALVHALMQRSDHRALGQYAELLYAETGDPRDIENAAKAFAGAGDYSNFLRIMEAFPFLQDRNSGLKRRYAWQLFQLGRLQEARQIADGLRASGSDTRDLNLEIAVAIESGQWEMLALPLTAFLDDSARQDGLALIRAAHLAQASGQGPFQELMDAAIRKSENDAQVLLGAYTLTIEGGLEEVKPEAHEWFRRALELSGPEGPVQQFELKELLAKQLEWNARSRSVDEAITRGDVPMIIGAPALGSTVVDVILGNFVRSSALVDPRRRTLVPIFSGRRAPMRVGEVKRVALDVSAVVVLGWLGLLPKTLEAFEEIVLPAGLLQELFECRRSIRALQKSRITRAQEIRNLVAGRLKVLRPPKGVPNDLAKEIGIELAELIRAAGANMGVVVRPAPVHRIGLDDRSNADVSAHAAHLTDMHSLLDALKELGAVDQHTEEIARRYFDLQDVRWSSSLQPVQNQPLYLDGLSVAYLQTSHLLGTVVMVFENVYIHSSTEDEASAILDRERQSADVLRTIDAVREAIRKADSAGKILFGPRSARAERDELRESSTLHLLCDLVGVDAVIVDDRALNKDFFVTDGRNHRARAHTSLDVIEELHAREVITDGERRAARHRLRVAGAALVPVDAGEIRNAVERNGQYGSAESRAIQESISLARVRKAPRFPAEVPWFVSVITAAKAAIMEVWKESVDSARAAALADAILEIKPNLVDWLSCWEVEPSREWVESVSRVTAAGLALPVELTDAKVRAAYNEWLEERVLEPMRTLDPERYRAVIDYVKSLILSLSRSNDDE